MLPNDTITENSTTVRPYKQATFEDWLTFIALGGVIINEDNHSIYKMSLTEFCTKYNVSKMTISRWRKQTPNLASKIERRRNEIMPVARLTAAYNQLFMIGMQDKDKRAAVEALKLFLGQFGNLKSSEKKLSTIDDSKLSWAELLNRARNVRIIDENS